MSSVRRAGMLVEAALALALASLALRVMRGSSSRLLGRVGSVERVVVGEIDSRARGVGRVVERVAAALPWRPSCLPQAIATRAMLRRRGIACEGHLGIVSTAPLEAHAWVTVAGRVVVGGPVQATELAAFR
ncbi:MAG TPA: lasso peptide biosynthesis B2 protein [Thermoleophilaceae bacterium]|nr:lasso peptide biosynthesis B2 protein [Thermoleophilaceae bacterium]